MQDFLIYTLKTIVALGLFALVYRFSQPGEINFRVRRIYLMSSVFLSLLLPLLSFDLNLILPGQNNQIQGLMLNEITIYSDGFREIREASSLPLSTMLLYLYLFITSVLLLRITFQIFRILLKTRKIQAEKNEGFVLYHLPFKNVSFSFFNFIFIGKTDEEDWNKILAHEKVHANQLHSLDVLIIEILCCIFWFNPLFWWYRREIKNVHEYLADEGALSRGFNRKSYQITLLEHLIGSASLSITNNFNYSQIKNRITMMNKEKHGKRNIWKAFLLLPVSILLVIGFACTEKTDDSAQSLQKGNIEIAYKSVEVMPEYPGGIKGLQLALMKELKYPVEAMLNNVAGKVYLQFVVDKDGKIVTKDGDYEIREDGKENTKVSEIVVVGYKGAEESVKGDEAEPYVEMLKKEAIRALSSVPSFDKPGYIDGKPAAVVYTLPIVFKMQ